LAVYGDRSQYDANQGDIFADVLLSVPMSDPSSDVMLISHDCDCDKYLRPSTPLTEPQQEAWCVTVAIVHPIELLTGGRPRAVRDDAMARYLHLPAEGEFEELVVDLWTEQPVRMVELLACERMASLSPEWRERLWWKIIRLRLGKSYRDILEGNVPDDEA
jgi:hypothetical protein